MEKINVTSSRDGTYNRANLPSSDYWVGLTQGQRKGHFTIKR